MLVLGDGVDRVDDPRKIGEEGEQEAEPELDLPCIDRILLASKPTRTQPHRPSIRSLARTNRGVTDFVEV